MEPIQEVVHDGVVGNKHLLVCCFRGHRFPLSQLRSGRRMLFRVLDGFDLASLGTGWRCPPVKIHQGHLIVLAKICPITINTCFES